MTILCVVAHPDDEVLGIGGTLARHADAGEDVHVCILSDGVTSRYDDTEAASAEIDQRRNNARRACDHLGATVTFHSFPDNRFDTAPLLDMVQTVEAEIERCDPNVLYTHHYGDLNVDHELTCRATVTATRPLKESGVNRVYAFETLSATEWSVPESTNAFQPTTFVDVTEHLDRKLTALNEYENELRTPPHPRTPRTVHQNASVWGAKSGVPAAEPLELLREVRHYS
ncbi:PIG-L deacetylase family protein [Haloplanus halophilus]|uniref:PIG-L deacetylase family protein n=1 Tax=Haloplanus halophilus TaxID=2949993 RepID=UPI0020426276|nr:PIG-L deacetylase family protein [Haloplanus sp. GDY1]